ncbi:histidine phosphatase family protein [Paenibacillus larvae]|uniref:histidine phosphatase family protein n=1 Tax=Paenibacillus larvae TaxID=1464 RepID=UPI002890AFBA|nr:histidine phosphatase family protein [Paenibacillus larvae]MDT2191689.1 histidine phosphatase family protein [Paenibacillus larvae]MDT2260056.1 histidine phosphatase family protein [Paenibacillus larvae]
MTTIGFIRHGITEWNRLGRIQGVMDIPLNDEGREQARKLGNRLKHENWDGIISSDLRRAKETSEIISQLSGIPVLEYDKRLRERFFGEAEGTTLEEREERWGSEWRNAGIGVETDEALLQRWDDFTETLFKKYPERRILLVSHGSFIGTILKDSRLNSLGIG